MRTAIETGLPRTAAPIEWATIGGDTIYTVQIPIRADGIIEDGDITAQAKVVFANLEKTLTAAGCTLGDVTQIQIFLADKADFPALNALYKTIFKPPYPNRSTVEAGLMVKNSRIEIVVHAHKPNGRGS